MKLLNLTVVRKNGVLLTTPTQSLFDINNILSPVRSNGVNSYFSTRSDRGNKTQDQFEVSETLSVIAAQSINLFYATVTKRRGSDINNEPALFNVDNVFKKIDVNGTGSKFLYNEEDQFQFIEYEVSQSPTIIYLETIIPSPPTYTFNNGITESGGTVQLGGNLIQNTNIDGLFNLIIGFTTALNNFAVYTQTNIHLQAINGINSSSLDANPGYANASSTDGTNSGTVLATPTLLSVLVNDGVNDAGILFYPLPQSLSGNGTNNNLIVSDPISQKGLMSDADYSANATNESYITKRYVTTYVAGLGYITSSALTPYLTIASAAATYLTIANAATTYSPLIPRQVSTASSATPTPNVDITDLYILTALAAAATFGIPTGTPNGGQVIGIRIKDNGTARALAFNAIYRFSTDLIAPTTTVINKTLYMFFIYNATDTKWDCINWINNF